jgi:alkane 1-monooxygenase
MRRLLSLWFPLNGLVFLATGPHRWWVGLVFLVPLVVAYEVDVRSRDLLRAPRPGAAAWPFDLVVYALAAIQLANIVLLARMFAQVSLASLDVFLAAIVVGVASGHSIITAHELIHRSRARDRWLGRLLLCTVAYEHFYTEHLRGHHARVGTPEDPATARFGETFHEFYRRTVPAQFASAWRLETARLGDPDLRLLDRRQWRNRVVHGLLAEAALAAAIALSAGGVALLAFALQALVASRLLEVVNYFEHWGLERAGRGIAPSDSWDTYAWFTTHSLVGLSRHADHHVHASRPYQELRVEEAAVRLPTGYIGTIVLVLARNRLFRQLATEELRRRRLGPFAPGRAV